MLSACAAPLVTRRADCCRGAGESIEQQQQQEQEQQRQHRIRLSERSEFEEVGIVVPVPGAFFFSALASDGGNIEVSPTASTTYSSQDVTSVLPARQLSKRKAAKEEFLNLENTFIRGMTPDELCMATGSVGRQHQMMDTGLSESSSEAEGSFSGRSPVTAVIIEEENDDDEEAN
mmetsp:Transcript_30205/g.65239  ORF Transcript_30205/g.65239 Transcript_30205/m.65239 type:complete len:175 (+) Transcript_30205:105-629(+)